MQPGDADLRSRIDDLVRRVERLERELSLLRGAAPVTPSPEPQAATTVPDSLPVRHATAETLPLVGRLLLVLAGAFALRAITETDVLPRGAGTALGFAYGLLWIVLADRSASRGRRLAAVFHGLGGAIIAFPLVFEATASFRLVSPRQGALALAVACVIGLVVAVRHALRSLAWIVAAGAAITSVALAAATRAPTVFTAFVLVLALGGLWLGYFRRWLALAWSLALLADALSLMLTLLVLRADAERAAELLTPGSVVALLLILPVIYIGSFVLRTVAWGGEAGSGEIAQGIAVLAIGLGGAVAVARASGLSGLSVDLVSLALAGVCYGASFVVIDRHQRRGNFVFYTSVGLMCALVALLALIEGSALAIALATIGLLVSWLGSTRKRVTLSLHGSIYLAAAAIVSGLIGAGVDSFTSPNVPARDWVGPAALFVLASGAIQGGLRIASHGRTWGRFSGVPKLIVLAVLALGVGSLAITAVAPLLPVSAEGATDAMALAVLRTGVLAAAAVVLAAAARWPRLREAAWLVYPVLIAGGLKLVAEDIPAGRAGGLLLSFALYGGALILAPRWVRRAS